MRKPLESWVATDCGYETPCHVWTRATNTGGYGLLHDGTKMRIAQRYFYEREHGPLPKGVYLHHLCNNPPCVNIGHLQPIDPVSHGRIARNLKLTNETAQEIRRRRQAGASLDELAEDFGVSRSNVWLVVSGKTWA